MAPESRAEREIVKGFPTRVRWPLDNSQRMRDCRNVSESLAEYVAGQLNAAMGRRRVSAMELARRMGKSDDWVGRRRNGDTAISMSDLDLFAVALDLPLSYFLPVSERVA